MNLRMSNESVIAFEHAVPAPPDDDTPTGGRLGGRFLHLFQPLCGPYYYPEEGIWAGVHTAAEVGDVVVRDAVDSSGQARYYVIEEIPSQHYIIPTDRRRVRWARLRRLYSTPSEVEQSVVSDMRLRRERAGEASA